ncbi:MAG: BadF/BadG/BcrA/BcrD ATPase family protein, partial [Thermoguttaceae bacterium]
MTHFCGIDIGASAAKLALIDPEGRLVAKAVRRSGINYARTAETCLLDALETAGLERADVAAACSTGYGRDNVPWADGKMTEIACHGRGAHFCLRRAMTIIDIGAQDS